MTCLSHSVVAVGRMGYTLCDIRSMSGDTACYDAFLDVICVRQAEMLWA